MVRNFSPREIHHLLRLPAGKTIMAHRISTNAGCRDRFKDLVRLVEEDSVPTQDQKPYQRWTK
jgi:hypothetical protein